MKFDLPGNLRALFGFLRVMMILGAFSFVAFLTFEPWIQSFTDNPRGAYRAGEVQLQFARGPVELAVANTPAGDLVVKNLQGTLILNYASPNRELVNRIRWVVLPFGLLGFAYYYLLFTALRTICANLETKTVFSDQNFRLVRRIGILMVGYSVVVVIANGIYSQVIGAYLTSHVAVVGFDASLGASINWPSFFPAAQSDGVFSRLVTGGLVLLMAAAVRQGVALKEETEFTV